MGCVSSKILAKSGSFQEKVGSSLGHSFQRSSAIEEIILSTSKSNGDQFLALLRASTSSARKAKEPAEAAAAAVAEPAAKIQTIDVSELLAGLEEEGCCTAEQARERRQSISRDGPPAPWPASDGGGAAGRARSFRTVEEFDAMVLTQHQQQQTQSECGSSSGRANVLATDQEEEELATATAEAATASTAEAELSGGSGSKAAVGAKRRARARQLGELNVPAAAAAFDFSISKSGSLRDWLRQGGQIFSPGSYVTPRFGTSPPAERGGAAAGDQQALFDPELVAQFERAMEQLSEDEGRVLDEILEALELEAAKKDDGTVAVVGGVRDGQPADVAAAALV